MIGRTKADSVELLGAEKPPTAHISRVETDVDGHELEIFRRSVPYGNVAGARAVLRRVQRGAIALSTGCSRACLARAATACTTASPTSRVR